MAAFLACNILQLISLILLEPSRPESICEFISFIINDIWWWELVYVHLPFHALLEPNENALINRSDSFPIKLKLIDVKIYIYSIFYGVIHSLPWIPSQQLFLCFSIACTIALCNVIIGFIKLNTNGRVL